MSKNTGTKPPFIVFEGIDASGKGTQISLLAAALTQAGAPFIETREPGGTPLAEAIRAHLLSGEARHLGPVAEVMLFNAARTEHLNGVIRPALNNGCIVVCDRFTASTLAYQGAGSGVDETWLASLHNMIVGETQPDVTIVLDIPVRESLFRQEKRDGAKDRFESEKYEFFERLREKYLQIARSNSKNHHIVDGMQPPDAIASIVFDIVEPFLD